MPAGAAGGARGHARFAGVVCSLQVEGTMTLVEIEAGPFLFRTAVSRDDVTELGLVEGAAATATVRGTSVRLEGEPVIRDGATRS